MNYTLTEKEVSKFKAETDFRSTLRNKLALEGRKGEPVTVSGDDGTVYDYFVINPVEESTVPATPESIDEKTEKADYLDSEIEVVPSESLEYRTVAMLRKRIRAEFRESIKEQARIIQDQRATLGNYRLEIEELTAKIRELSK